jgi:hypothetical protein
MIRFLDRLMWSQGAIIFSVILGIGFGVTAKYVRTGWAVVAGAFVFAFIREFIHARAVPKKVKRLTTEDIHGPDSIEEYLAQRRKE